MNNLTIKYKELFNKPFELSTFLENIMEELYNSNDYDINDIIQLFKEGLTHFDSNVKQVSLIALMFQLNSVEDAHVNKAIEFLFAKNKSKINQIDTDLQMWAATCLGASFKGTKDKKILIILFKAINEVDDESVKINSLQAMLSIYFNWNSVDVLKIYGKLLMLGDPFYKDIVFSKLRFNEVLNYINVKS